MAFRSVFLGVGFDQLTPEPLPEGSAAEGYAVTFCAQESAHLAVYFAVPVLRLASAGLLPLSRSLVDEVNAERAGLAEKAQKRIANAVAISGVAAEYHTIQKPHSETCDRVAAAARLSDLAIISRPSGGVSLDQRLIEVLLFTSGRPVLAVPPQWERGPQFDNIMVAWDGGQRAARAVGDAMPFLERAKKVEILCVSPDAPKSFDGADLAAHLARHCRNVTVTNLAPQAGDIARTLTAHAKIADGDLLVMGAYGHPRLVEMVLGGVTSGMLVEAEVPVLLSY
ncbi:MAG TPA: universal stress protein [Methylocella sp.]|nr:universal stress protein [Methylocella sp.]